MKRFVFSVLIPVFFLTAVPFAPPAIAAQRELFPGVAKANGYNHTVWHSEAILYNQNGTSQQVTLEIVPRDGGASAGSRTYTLQAGEIRSIPDVYGALSAGTGVGTLEVDGDVTTWVRTFNQGSSGTFGLSVPGASTVRHGAGAQVLFPVHTPASIANEFRSNLLLLLYWFSGNMTLRVGV